MSVGLEERGRALLLTIERPDKLNALNELLIEDLFRAVEEVRARTLAESGPRALVVTGAGKAFSAGVDIEELVRLTPAEAHLRSQRGQALCAGIEALPVPTIAALNGAALGGGFELALACDFLYASETARIGLPEVSLGVLPGHGGTQRLAARVGPSQARWLIYSGDIVDARAAVEMGAVDRVFAPAELLSQALATAERFASRAPLAIAQAKSVLRQSATLAIGLELESQAFALLFGTEDQKEGMRAFIEKRTACFRGR